MPLISPTPWSQYQRPGAVTPQAASVIPEVAHSTVNAAGTSENVAMHVAVIVALAILGVWALRQSGFKFAVAGSLG